MNRLIHAMMNGVHSCRLMDAEPGPAGGAGDGNPPPSDPPPGDPPKSDPPPSDPPPGDPPKSDPPKTDPPKTDPPKKGDGEINLLDGDGEGGSDGEGDGDGETAPTEEQISEWRKGVKALDLGDDVEFDDGLLDRITPSLMKLSDGDPSKAEAIVKAYTEYALELNRKAVERDEAFNSQLVAACRERFGKDIRRVAHQADAGGKTIFGDKLWNEIRSVRQFANNPDIMERLAAFGRGAASDRGVSADKGGGRNARPVSLSEQLGI